jgi:signal transduction histidine kinase
MSNVALFPTDPVREERFSETDVRRRLEDERLQIARELHDIVAHTFSTIVVQAGVAAQMLEDRPQQVPEALDAIRSASREALAEFRTILGVLRQSDESPDARPSLARLESLAEGFASIGLRTRVVVLGHPRQVPVEVDRAGFRIVQESLTNALRHSGSAKAFVYVAYEPNRLVLTIEDYGTGRPTGSGQAEPGNGIRGMRERAERLGGEFHAGSRPGGGFRVTARFPTSVQH